MCVVMGGKHNKVKLFEWKSKHIPKTRSFFKTLDKKYFEMLHINTLQSTLISI